jgi:hypothetical protein
MPRPTRSSSAWADGAALEPRTVDVRTLRNAIGTAMIAVQEAMDDIDGGRSHDIAVLENPAHVGSVIDAIEAHVSHVPRNSQPEGPERGPDLVAPADDGIQAIPVEPRADCSLRTRLRQDKTPAAQVTRGAVLRPDPRVIHQSGRAEDGSVSLFNIDKENVKRSDYNPATFRSDTEVSDDRSRGFETEPFLNLTESIQTVMSYSYIDAKTVRSVTLAKGLRLEGATPHRFTLWTSYGVRSGPLAGLRLGGGVVRAAGPIQQFGTSKSRFFIEDGYTTVGAFARYQTAVRRRPLSLGVNVDTATHEFYIRSRAGVSEPRRTVFSAQLDF